MSSSTTTTSSALDKKRQNESSQLWGSIAFVVVSTIVAASAIVVFSQTTMIASIVDKACAQMTRHECDEANPNQWVRSTSLDILFGMSFVLFVSVVGLETLALIMLASAIGEWKEGTKREQQRHDDAIREETIRLFHAKDSEQPTI
jgi:hypothetical protein